MIANVLLIRYFGGWHERTNPDSIPTRGRRETLLGLGAAQSTGEVERIADGQLTAFARDRVAVAADVDPTNEAATPYLGYKLGDAIVIPARFRLS